MSQARCRPNISAISSRVRIIATRWPVCQTPPRVVTHQTCVEKPSSSTRATRSRIRSTPIRPAVHHASSTTVAASPALIPDCHWSAVTRADDRHQRHQQDRGERRERHVDVAVPVDHVVGAQGALDPHPAVEEGVREVEEVAAPGIERAVGQPVDDEGADGEQDAGDGRGGRGDRRARGHMAEGSASGESAGGAASGAERARPAARRASPRTPAGTPAAGRRPPAPRTWPAGSARPRPGPGPAARPPGAAAASRSGPTGSATAAGSPPRPPGTTRRPAAAARRRRRPGPPARTRPTGSLRRRPAGRPAGTPRPPA